MSGYGNEYAEKVDKFEREPLQSGPSPAAYPPPAGYPPPPNYPPSAGYQTPPNYPQPAGYPPAYASVGQQVVVAQPQQVQQLVIVQQEELPPNGNMICFSVFVLICCSCGLGIVALIFAGD